MAEAAGSSRQRRTRRGRRRSGNWKPYSELSWEERRALEERAAKRREAQELLGEQPAAKTADRRGAADRGSGAERGPERDSARAPHIPPAPLITSSALMDEREQRAAVPELDDDEEEEDEGPRHEPPTGQAGQPPGTLQAAPRPRLSEEGDALMASDEDADNDDHERLSGARRSHRQRRQPVNVVDEEDDLLGALDDEGHADNLHRNDTRNSRARPPSAGSQRSASASSRSRRLLAATTEPSAAAAASQLLPATIDGAWLHDLRARSRDKLTPAQQALVAAVDEVQQLPLTQRYAVQWPWSDSSAGLVDVHSLSIDTLVDTLQVMSRYAFRLQALAGNLPLGDKRSSR